MKTEKSLRIRKVVLTGILSALVIILQIISSAIKFGPFSITLSLIPIIVGAAIAGPLVGGWLGLVFGLTVLLSGDATWFMEYNAAGTIITVLVKGIGCGLCAGFIYKAMQKYPYPAAMAASVCAPVVNTGLFVVGCLFFFTELVGSLKTIILSVVGTNFLVELCAIFVLAPVVVRVIDIWQKKRK